MQKQKSKKTLKKKITNLGLALNSLNIGNERICQKLDEIVREHELTDPANFILSNDLVDKWRHYNASPTDPIIRKAISWLIKGTPEKFYEIVAPRSYLIDLLYQRIKEYNLEVTEPKLKNFKKQLMSKRSQYTTMRNESSSHARWDQLFEAILFCQLLEYSRQNNLRPFNLTLELYNQVMNPDVLITLVNTELLSKDIKKYIDSAPAIYERSLQLIAVQTLLKSIDGYLLLS
ncbi:MULTISPECIES: hypothetical protein [Lactobacillus]|uniref:Uncharacterized protein n=1 Tax=Lactobacillus xujianguonis TaxID=2495899 RepID=A0A437SUW1_9LACO|nr:MULTISPECIES: hypothetical protein [Lactobacillus]RVU70716.1 hypothetical protein EJK17_06230 [Lactobacillus xujianguonis]